MPMRRGKRAGSKTPTVDYAAGCLVRSTSTKCPTKKSRTSSSPPISRPENAWASRPLSRRSSKSLAKTCKSGLLSLLHLDLEARHRITYSLIVPAMFNLCLLAPTFDQADLSAWRVSGYGGAIMPEVTLERIAQKLPQLQLINTYGSTETTSPAVFMPPEEAVVRKDCVGLTVPCGHIVVLDPDGVEVPYGTPGE